MSKLADILVVKFRQDCQAEVCWDDIAVRHLVETIYSELKKERTSLRDQFAMAAILPASIGVDNEFANTIAEHAYKIADAMLRARES